MQGHSLYLSVSFPANFIMTQNRLFCDKVENKNPKLWESPEDKGGFPVVDRSLMLPMYHLPPYRYEPFVFYTIVGGSLYYYKHKGGPFDKWGKKSGTMIGNTQELFISWT